MPGPEMSASFAAWSRNQSSNASTNEINLMDLPSPFATAQRVSIQNKMSLEDMERSYIAEVLEHTRGKKTMAHDSGDQPQDAAGEAQALRFGPSDLESGSFDFCTFETKPAPLGRRSAEYRLADSFYVFPANPRNCHAQELIRIYRAIVYPNFVVEMGACGTAAHADVANDLSAGYSLSSVDRKCRHMTVTGDDAIRMLDLDQSSVPFLVPRKQPRHQPGPGRDVRFSRDIDAAMECAFPVERIDTLAERTRDSSFHRPELGSLCHAYPVGNGGFTVGAHADTDRRGPAHGCLAQCVKAVDRHLHVDHRRFPNQISW